MRLFPVVLVFLMGCPEKGAGPKVRPAPLVVAAPVEMVDAPVLVRAPVGVRPIVSADVGSKTMGTSTRCWSTAATW